MDAVVAEVRRGFTPRTVLDPACGDGRFLAPFAATAQITGVDIDPNTAFIRDDALRRDWGAARFDAVVGNPPFLNQLAAATSRGGTSTHGGGAYADAAAEFLALAMQLARPGGRVGLVLPLSMLGSRDVAPIRALVSKRAALRWMWWSPTSMFDANVRTWAGVWEIGGTQGQVLRSFGPDFVDLPAISMPSAWTGLIADRPPPPASDVTLGSIASFTADFRDQYYGLVGSVVDDAAEFAAMPKLITSGLIDPGRVAWGQRPVRFAKTSYSAPRVVTGRLSPPMQRWAAARLQPKILIANQTPRIEAVVDHLGEYLPSVPVITCLTEHADAVIDVLNSDDANDFVRYHAAGTGLSAASVRLTAKLLASIPLPSAVASTVPSAVASTFG